MHSSFHYMEYATYITTSKVSVSDCTQTLYHFLVWSCFGCVWTVSCDTCWCPQHHVDTMTEQDRSVDVDLCVRVWHTVPTWMFNAVQRRHAMSSYKWQVKWLHAWQTTTGWMECVCKAASLSSLLNMYCWVFMNRKGRVLALVSFATKFKQL